MNPIYPILISLTGVIVMALMNFYLIRRNAKADLQKLHAEAIEEGARREAVQQIQETMDELKENDRRRAASIGRIERQLAALTGKANGQSYRIEEA